MTTVTEAARRLKAATIQPIVACATRPYVAGPELADAMRAHEAIAARGHRTTLALWDGPDDSPPAVQRGYLDCLDALGLASPDSYLSIKLPALGFSIDLLNGVKRRADDCGIRLHFDSLAPETADDTWSAVESLVSTARPGVGCTLPGRWRRSVPDTERVIEHGLDVRVVKGQWPDPDAPDLDPTRGFLSVIDRLAGRARHVSVATHDVPLAEEAFRRLRAAGTPCDLELLYGLPQRPSLALATTHAVAVRFYVPYGAAYLPYVLSKARRQPRIVWWLLKDAAIGLVRQNQTNR